VPPPAAVGADPFLTQLWHLNSARANSADIRAFSAWALNKGENSRIVVIDDAIEINHPDLAPNVVTGGSYNYFGGVEPLPCSADDGHGTQVAGLATARDNNGIGVAGAAPRAKLVGFNALNASSDSSVIDALQRDLQKNQIYNNSWGSDDDGLLHSVSFLWEDATTRGIKTGRAGKGAIYVYAGGNGGAITLKNNSLHVDNSNFDGYVNRHGVIAVCSTDEQGNRSTFGEFGVNQWVCAPSFSNVEGGTRTTAIGGNYSNNFAGTSASAPIVSGVVALMLTANPNLTWRDVPLILAQTARKTNLTDANWNGSGQTRYNPFLGFGVVDADAAVQKAATWVSVGNSTSLVTCTYNRPNLNLAIPDATATTLGLVTDSANVQSACGIGKIEYVDVELQLNHPYKGELNIQLTSPNENISQLTYPQTCGVILFNEPNPCAQPMPLWRFGVVRHMDENPNGLWQLKVIDTKAGDVGTLLAWKLTVYGRP
jgi:proprotein convertase subtilisin/kexin type 2